MQCPDCRYDNIKGAEICANCGRDLAGLDLPDSAPGADFIQEPLSVLPRRQAFKVGLIDPVGLAVRYMQHHNTDCVLVTNGSELLGIITLWDVLHKVVGRGDDLNAIACEQIMTPDPVTLREDDNIAVAINIMSVRGFRHIPTVAGDRSVTGIVSISDVFHHISPHLV
jgi:CBS domain-containing protein